MNAKESHPKPHTPLLSETVLSLNEAAGQFPRVGGRKPHLSTLWRWCRKGLRVNGTRVRLEYGRAGRRIFTSRQALARFTEALADADLDPTEDQEEPPPARRLRPAKPPTAAQRRGSISRAQKALDDAGI